MSSFTTKVPTRPLAVTLSVKFDVLGAQVAVTVVLAVMVPVALLLKVQVCPVG